MTKCGRSMTSRSVGFSTSSLGTKEKHVVAAPEVLIATPDGWICPSCDYTQDWAHGFMADGSWRAVAESNPFYTGFKPED